MKYQLIFTQSYVRRARKFFKKHPDILGQYEKTLALLELNPQHPSLRLHALRGSLEGLSSASINMSYRIILELLVYENEIILVDIGSHDRVY